MTETIVIEVTWEAPEGTLAQLEHDGGDGTLLQTALDAWKAGAPIDVASRLEMNEPPPPAPIPLSEWRSAR